MTDTLIRISCSETGDFSKLMLAPGLPMLDGKMLTYQVLQGWLRDLLAEPELDGDNVLFHVHVGGERQRILSRSFVTHADLEGPLAGDYAKLRQSLGDVKPVSPSERLIFSRLQPPVGETEGFLLKARTEDGIDRLVWCWGYQRRVSEGSLAICPASSCSALFLKQGGPAEMCPHCGELLVKPQAALASQPTHRRRRPVGAIIAAGVLISAALATYFFPVNANSGVDPEEPQIGDPKTQPDEPKGKAPQSVTRNTPEDTMPDEIVPSSPKVAQSIPRDDKELRPPVDVKKEPKKKEAKARVEAPAVANVPKTVDPLPEFKPFKLPEIPALDPAPSQPDVPTREVAKEPAAFPSVIVPEPVQPSQPTITSKRKIDSKIVTGQEPQPLFPVEPKVAPKKDKVQPLFPDFPKREPMKIELPQLDPPQKTDIPQPEISKPSSVPTEKPLPDVIKTPPAITILPPEPVSPQQPVAVQPKTNDNGNTPVLPTAPQKTVGDRQWHGDYLAAYQQAINDKKMLVMLFHDASNPDLSETRTSGFGAGELQESLDKYVRVSLPINFVAPSADPNAPRTRLLEHRSFRHLRDRAGVAIVDLTDAQGPNYGRVVSALPLPSDGRYSPEVLGTLLQLPSGSIGQRSIVLAVRTGVSGDNFTLGDPKAELHQLANRNARLMAQAEQAGSYDQVARVTAIRESFGDDIRIGELYFASEGPATVQEAAIQAVSKWMQSPEERRTLEGRSFAYGIELFQSPSSQRWFATCIVLSR